MTTSTAQNSSSQPAALNILGIFLGHDASAALLKYGEIAAVIQEERISRVKHQRGFPKEAIAEVLRLGNLTPDKINFIAVAGNDRRIESLKELWRALSGNRFYSCVGLKARFKTALADNTKNYLKFRKNLKDCGLDKAKLHYIEHHLAHASSAYRNSGMDEALVLTVDGVGDDISASASVAKQGAITRIAETRGKNSIGLLYQSVTEALGFVPIEGEYKTMGLASYGNEKVLESQFKDLISCLGLRFQSRHVWESEFKFPYPSVRQHLIFKEWLGENKPEDLAAACQDLLEKRMIEFVSAGMQQTGMKNLCCAGGVFLNVKTNQAIREKLKVENYYFHADAGDAGLALGAAQQVLFRLTGQPRMKAMEHVHYGTEYSDAEIEAALKTHTGSVAWKKSDSIARVTAELLAQGKVVGWFQGKMEMGPRALGARSVLADSRNQDVKERINKVLKKRELFVPFAPSMLQEDAQKYIRNFNGKAPFMIMTFDADPQHAAEIPAVVHVDGTLRPQVVKKEINPKYFELLTEFKKITGIGVLVNTSFNRHGLPIVRSPEDALNHLLDENVDVLAMGSYIVTRAADPSDAAAKKNGHETKHPQMAR